VDPARGQRLGELWPVGSFPALDLGELGAQLLSTAVEVIGHGLPLGLQAQAERP
jgi:hypothetical protein